MSSDNAYSHPTRKPILAYTKRRQVRSGELTKAGTLVSRDADGRVLDVVTTLPIEGEVIESKAGGKWVTVKTNHIVNYSLPGVTMADVGKTAYAADNNTLTLTSNSAIAGPIVDVNVTGERAFVHLTLQIISELNMAENYIEKSANYTAAAGDDAIGVDTGSGDVTITLPAATGNSGVRIRVSKITSDANIVIVATTGADKIGFQPQWTLSNQGDSLTAISDGATDWILFTERHATGDVEFPVEPDANMGNHRVQSIAGAGTHRFEFIVPSDFLSLIDLHIIGNPTSGASGAGKDIDFFSDYAALGEVFNNHTESDTGQTFDFTGQDDKFVEMDISSVFSAISAHDICGFLVDQNSVGGSIRYVGIHLVYLRSG